MPLVGSGISPVVVLTPPSLVFGTQTIGSTSPAQTVVLQNTGSAALTVNSFTVKRPVRGVEPGLPHTSCDSAGRHRKVQPGGNLQPHGGRPSIRGCGHCRQQLASRSSLSPGHGGAPGTTVTPANVTFGSQPVGTVSAPQTVTLTNTGSAAIGVSNVAATANFQHTNTCPASLPAGDTCTISVSFAPTTGGATAGAALATTDNGVVSCGIARHGGRTRPDDRSFQPRLSQARTWVPRARPKSLP